MTLKSLGFDSWFREREDEDVPADARPCRVISVHRNSYIISSGGAPIHAEVTGNLLHGVDSPLDLPAVGDWVQAKLLDDDTFAVIYSIYPRKSCLARKAAGAKTDYQLIAANVDTAVIVQGLDNDFNPRRLERYLAIVTEGGIVPVVLLSKSDLVSSEIAHNYSQHISDLMSGLRVLAFSNTSGQGFAAVSGLFLPGKTYCLIGSSGVGKTTLLNRLLGEQRFRTKEVRAGDGKGRHATTARQLIVTAGGALIVDTPGMRELGAIGVDAGIEETFREITRAAASCRFSDCSHTGESGCSVMEALGTGKITRERYDAFLKLRRESEFHAMSYQEKRRRDREFGKMVKSVMKHKKGENRG